MTQLFGIGRQELEVLKAFEEMGEAYNREVAREKDVGSDNVVRKARRRLINEGYLEESRREGNTVYYTTTESGIKRLRKEDK